MHISVNIAKISSSDNLLAASYVLVRTIVLLKLFLKSADVLRRPQRFEKVSHFVLVSLSIFLQIYTILYRCFQVQKICFNNLCNKQLRVAQHLTFHFQTGLHFIQVLLVQRNIQYTLELRLATLKNCHLQVQDQKFCCIIQRTVTALNRTSSYKNLYLCGSAQRCVLPVSFPVDLLLPQQYYIHHTTQE